MPKNSRTEAAFARKRQETIAYASYLAAANRKTLQETEEPVSREKPKISFD